MLFNSFVFAGIFLPLCVLCFWLARGSDLRRAILLVFSLVFYAYWSPPYLVLLVALVGIAWASALAAERTESTWPVWVAATGLLGALAYYKYSAFLARVLIDAGFAGHVPSALADVILPLGISFIVFQALGYVIDVHRRQFHAERSFSTTLLFKAFFPQLIAGPICRAHELIPQLKSEFRFNLDKLASGVMIFCVGLFLKLAFADALAPLVDQLFARSDTLSRVDAWGAAVGFGFQIYADFWGYSTMAVGLALMFGIDIPINFRLPYLATSIRDFWRRWHITLSQWLRDYLYISLGGSRHGRLRTAGALFTTMLLGGLWHGANYTFIVWGAIHGVALTIEHLVLKKRNAGASNGAIASVAGAAGYVYTMLLVFVAWVFFRARDIDQAVHMVRTMAVGDGAAPSAPAMQIALISAILFLVQIPAYRLIDRARTGGLVPHLALPAAFYLLLVAIVMGAPQAVPFIYFEF